MDDTQEQDHYEERLKEVFNSFDLSGSGSLSLEELSDLCQSLHLDDATPALLHTLLQNQDRLTARVDFDQFKNALILVLSSTIEPPQSPEIQPKFVKGSKRYGRRSTPEFIEPISDLSEFRNANPVEEEDLEDNYDSRWNAHETSTEEYEAEGQMHLWNPDEPSTPRGSNIPLSACLEERLREACDELAISWDGCAGHTELLALCEHLGLEINVDMLQSLTGDGVMNVQEFVSRVVNHNKPPTPSASTPYRQLKRLHSTQPFDEGGRRIATPSALTSTIGMRLFSTLDDGTGFTPVEYILDAWMEEGIENSTEILQALNFNIDGKVSLSDLTMALENELLVTKNGIHQAALASFKAEIRHLLERVDRELREKEKIRSDLEKAEKLKTQLATEVDEHHSAIEHTNNLNLRKLEQDHKEKLAAVRSDLMKEMDQLQQQANLQREGLEAEVEKIREDESFLRDHLSISVKENRRLEMELLDSTEKLVEAQNQITKLQTSVDNIMKERFGGLDPGSADFFLQEERIKQLRSSYEAQCRELQDRIDELHSELQEFHSLGRVHQPCHKPLSEELESKSPGMESDPGIGSEEVQPFSMSLEAEMMLEHLKEQHLQEMEELRNQLESKVSLIYTFFIVLHCELRQDAEMDENLVNDMKELRKQQATEIKKLDDEHVELCEARLEEERKKLQEEQAELEKRLIDDCEREKELLQQNHEDELKARLEEAKVRFEEERDEIVQRLTEQWQKERAQLDEQNNESLQVLLEEEMLRLVREQEEKESKLREQWEIERAQLQERHEEALLDRILQERLQLQEQFEQREKRLKEEWERERLQLEEDYEGIELKALSESHVEQKLHWEAQIQEALENAGEQRRIMEEAMELERESLDQQWKKERHELESLHKEEMEELATKNRQLQNELDVFISRAQTKEIELSRQLNDLHNRLQESLETKDELLAQSEMKALETELLLNQIVEDFKQERAELLSLQSELEAKNNEMLSISERQIIERIQLLTERDDLKMKIEELEMLLKQAVMDFEFERRELQEHVSILEKKVQDNVDNDREELIAEIDLLKIRIKQLEMELNQVLSSILLLILKGMFEDDLTSCLCSSQNRVLEMALHSSGLQSQSKKRYRDEMSRLMEQDQQLLRQENERLQAEMRNIKADLVQSREKVHQLDATILSLKQHKQPSQSSLVKALEQENASLKHELEAQKELTKDERERKMKNMEERMREIELSLRNVKLLLKEKVAQLKDQLHKNGKADVLISDLYVENAQLLKALEITEQRQKIAEKKNYLLEEKISSLNKIVRDLNPSPLPSLPYHY
uniref:Ninein (GSK3B interacting protein) n=1 Tax=Dicentrarchus labrax TaxID=13489 RepID=A0A8C4IKS8_DICLA